MAKNEVVILKDCFNQKINFLKNNIFDTTTTCLFSEHVNTANFGIGDFLLECKIHLPDELYHKIVTSQDFRISLELFKSFGSNESRKSIEGEKRLFYYSPPSSGWALPYLHEQATQKELLVLFKNRDNSQFYDLIKPVSAQILVDAWFQQLLTKSTASIEQY